MIYRSTFEKLLGGICSGVADHYCLCPIVIRVLFSFIVFVFVLLLTMFFNYPVNLIIGLGIPFLIYMVLWMVMPKY